MFDQWSGRLAVALLLFVGLGMVAGYTMGSRVVGDLADSTADWLVVSAARDGLNPYGDLLDLASTYDVAYAPVGQAELGPFTRVHPRAPGALLILSPLAGLPIEAVHPLVMTMTLVAIAVAWLWVTPRLPWTQPRDRWVLIGCVLLGSMAFMHALEFGAHSGLLLLLVSMFWVGGARGDGYLPGVALGVAMTLRIFPGLLLLVALWYGRKKIAAAALATFLVLNTIGMVVFTLDLSEVSAGLGSAAGGWMGFSGNGSLVMPLVRAGIDPLFGSVAMVAIGVAAWQLWANRRPRATWDSAVALGILLMTLSSPLSWDHYDMMLLPVVGWLLIDKRRWPVTTRLLALSWVLLQLTGILIDSRFGDPTFGWHGTLSLTGRLVLVAALVAGSLHTKFVSSVRVPARS